MTVDRERHAEAKFGHRLQPREGEKAMWLFSNTGFVSVVQKPGDSDLTLRARDRQDLERLKKMYLPKMGAVRAGGGADYPFRAKAPREAVAQAMTRIVAAIDYENFKDETMRKLGHQRHEVMSKVWTALLSLEPRAAHRRWRG